MKDLKKYMPQFAVFLAICATSLIFLDLCSDSNEGNEVGTSETETSEVVSSPTEEPKVDDVILGCRDTDVDVIIPPEIDDPPVSSGNIAEDIIDNQYEWFSVEAYLETMYATSSVNVRILPSVNFDKVGMLSYGDSIVADGKCNNGWYRVLYNGSHAYISGSYLAVKEPSYLSAPEYTGMIVVDGEVDSKWLYKLEANYNKVPQNVRTHFESSGWSIICTNQHLGYLFYSDSSLSIQAVNYALKKQIWVEARDSAMSSIVHEMGHYIDFNQSWVSSSDEFSSIYSEEVQLFKSIVTTHENNTSTPAEYFAEAYAISVEYPDLMIQYCPKTYEFVMRYSDSL